MKKIILFILFLTLITNELYARTIYKYQNNKKTEQNFPIKKLKYTDNMMKSKISYEIKGKIIDVSGNPIENCKIDIIADAYYSDSLKDAIYKNKNEKKKQTYTYTWILTQLAESNEEKENKNKSYKNEVYTDSSGNFFCRGEFYHSVYTISLFFNDYIYQKIDDIKDGYEVNILNPVSISYTYNESTKSFNVNQTIYYISENGKLEIKNIIGNTDDIITLKQETLSTQYYIELKKEEEKKIEEKRKAKEEKILAIAEKIKDGQNIAGIYSIEDIHEAYNKYLVNDFGWMNAKIVQIISNTELLVYIFGTDYCYLKFAKNFKADYFRAGQTYRFFYKYHKGDIYSYKAINGNKNTIRKCYLYCAVPINVFY